MFHVTDPLNLPTNYVAYILREALGDPPATPPGCNSIIVSCLQVLSAEEYPQLGIHHDPLLRQMTQFLTIPRSQIERDALADTLRLCRCSSGRPSLRDAPRCLHDEYAPFYRLVEDMASCLSSYLNDRDLPRTYAVARHAKRRVRGSLHVSSMSLEELLPSGLNDSVQALISWFSLYRGEEALMMGVANLLYQFLRAYEAGMVPVLIAHGRDFMNWLVVECIRNSNSLTMAMRQHNLLEVNVALASLLEIGIILIQLRGVTSWHRRELELLASTADGSEAVLSACKAVVLACETVDAVYPDLETTARQASDPFAFVTTTLLLSIGGDYIPLSGSWRITEGVVNASKARSDPYKELEATFYSLAENHRCAAPECLQTRAGMRRQLARCAGCFVASYCSPVCQRSAWRHATAPHRDVCRILQVAGGVLIPPGPRSNLKYQNPALITVLSEERARAAASNFGRLRNAKFEHLGQAM